MGTSHLIALCAGTLRRFAGCGRGNIAIITALVLVPLLAMVGGSVDLMRMTVVQNKMRAALEAGALAGAALVREDNKIDKSNLKNAVEDYVAANLPSGAPWDEISITVNRQSAGTEVVVDGSVTIKNFFLGVINKSTSNISESAAADTGGFRSLEISLVLDISSSMASDGKMDALRPAATDLIDAIFSRFGQSSTSVNLIPFAGGVNIGSALFDKYAVANIDADAVDPGPDVYKPDTNGDAVNNQQFRFTDRTDETGGNCIEIADKEFDDGTLPENQAGELPDFTRYGGLSWCPSDKSAAIFLENDRNTLVDRITGMEISAGTGMDIGMFWAVRAMSPHMRGELGGDFKERPTGWGTGHKIVIMMSDGYISYQNRPYDIDEEVHGGESNEQIVYDAEKAAEFYLKMCGILKNHGVVVYTVGYEVGSSAKSLLQNCATSSDKHYSDATALNISSVFQEVLGKLAGTELRISK